ncbi:MAG: hypothetical protein HQ565_07830 [Bacteroidetes bacterium]|nr:hypothetical protein [Bacteroidota bacterium]
MSKKRKETEIDWDYDEEEVYEIDTFTGIKHIIKWVEKNRIDNLDYEPVKITGFKSSCDLTVSDNYVRLRIDVDHSDYKEQRKWKRLLSDCNSIEKYKAEVDLT